MAILSIKYDFDDYIRLLCQLFSTQLKPSLDASLTLAVLVLLLDLPMLRTAVLIVQGHTSVMEDSACSAQV